MGHNDRTDRSGDNRRIANDKKRLMDQRAPQLTNENVDAAYQKALALAELGIWVFPANRNKLPFLGTHGFQDATIDPAEILKLWVANKAVYVGVHPKRSGLFCIDIDDDPLSGKHGRETILLDALDMPDTFSYPSQSETGDHRIYASPAEHPAAKNGIRQWIDRKSGDSHFIWYGPVPESRDVFKAPAPWMLAGKTASAHQGGTVREWEGELAQARATMLPGHIPAELDFEPADYASMEEAVKVLVDKLVYFPETEGLRDAFDQARSYYLMASSSDDAERNFDRRFKWEYGKQLAQLEEMGAELWEWAKNMEARREIEIVIDETGRPENVLPVLKRADILARPQPQWLIEGLLRENTLALLAADPGMGKSFLALHMAAAICTGGAFFDNPGDGTLRRALYACAEDVGDVPRRQDWLEERHGFDVDLFDQQLDTLEEGVNLSDEKAMARLRAQLAIGEYDFLIVDTLSALGGIENENDAGEVAKVIRNLTELRRMRPGMCILVIHHMSAGGRVRGSTTIRANMDTIIVMKGADPKVSGVTLSTEVNDGGKQKSAPGMTFGKLVLRDGAFDLRRSASAAADAAEDLAANPKWQAIREALILKPWQSVADLAETLRRNERQVRRDLDEYAQMGDLITSKVGRTTVYSLPEEY